MWPPEKTELLLLSTRKLFPGFTSHYCSLPWNFLGVLSVYKLEDILEVNGFMMRILATPIWWLLMVTNFRNAWQREESAVMMKVTWKKLGIKFFVQRKMNNHDLKPTSFLSPEMMTLNTKALDSFWSIPEGYGSEEIFDVNDLQWFSMKSRFFFSLPPKLQWVCSSCRQSQRQKQKCQDQIPYSNQDMALFLSWVLHKGAASGNSLFQSYEQIHAKLMTIDPLNPSQEAEINWIIRTGKCVIGVPDSWIFRCCPLLPSCMACRHIGKWPH